MLSGKCAGIRAIPDGMYELADCYDSPEVDGELDFSCALTISGDEMHLHLDALDQLRAGINMTYTALLSTIYYAVKAVVDPLILPNSGLARPLHVTACEGSMMNCVHPAGVNGRLGACQQVVDLIHGALARVAPERVTTASNGACGSVTCAGGWIMAISGSIWKTSAVVPARMRRRTGWAACICI